MTRRRCCLVLAQFTLLAALGATAARGANYTLDTVNGSQFSTAAAMNPPAGESFVRTYPDPAAIDEHLLAYASAGAGTATAKSELHYATTSSTITASGAIAGTLHQGDAAEVITQTESYLDQFFRVAAPTQFQFDSAVTLNLDPQNSDQAFTIVATVGGSNYGEGASGFVGSSGTLSPGLYRVTGHVTLLYDTIPSWNIPLVDSHASFRYLLTLTPLPVPTKGTSWGRVKALYR